MGHTKVVVDLLQVARHPYLQDLFLVSPALLYPLCLCLVPMQYILTMVAAPACLSTLSLVHREATSRGCRQATMGILQILQTML